MEDNPAPSLTEMDMERFSAGHSGEGVPPSPTTDRPVNGGPSVSGAVRQGWIPTRPPSEPDGCAHFEVRRGPSEGRAGPRDQEAAPPRDAAGQTKGARPPPGAGRDKGGDKGANPAPRSPPGSPPDPAPHLVPDAPAPRAPPGPRCPGSPRPSRPASPRRRPRVRCPANCRAGHSRTLLCPALAPEKFCL